MDADDLDRRALTQTGCIPPAMVSRLVELGHVDEVRSLAGRGEWFCAREWARRLAGQGRQAEALEVLAPYVATGWWAAAEETAHLLEGWGRVDEAIALLRARVTTSVDNRDRLADLLARHDRIEDLQEYAAAEHHGHAAQRLAELLEERGDVNGAIAVYRGSTSRQGSGQVRLAELLTRHGRGEEALEVLRTLADAHSSDDWIVHTLCEHYAALGRPEDGLAYLDARKERRGAEEWEFFWMRLPLMVACGRRAEAIELTKAHPEGDSWYAARSIAELLADEGRHQEAVDILEPHDLGDLMAQHLIELGRVGDAVTLLQRPRPRPPAPMWTGSPDDPPPF
ncbi:hypothetical protein Q0Z83_045850 [Actinoplanes sichuanensis]|uniref:Tetratricopeptide repeat protein n=1 Tax=Actinoplanes sichuanensis TaxID=512349 RepID=A0ABW4AAR1_9ACTN|nr:hypothetical protein [Actinoplanes sichuanensis]BEL06394.1 hypothetical protein Q0Z83_045850 [Actinoplanes sichuanensis]